MGLEIGRIYMHKRSKDLYRIIEIINSKSVRVQSIGFNGKYRTLRTSSLIKRNIIG